MWIDDQILTEYAQPLIVHSFVPDAPVVVLGSSNTVEREVNIEFCERHGIQVVKRYGGGGAVVLYSGCIVVSSGMWVRQHFNNQEYFQRINQAVIDVLADKNSKLKSLLHRGLSDISFKEKKIAGTSLFRSRNYLLYQASIVVEPNLELINNCLCHPSKEPDYRAGRTHGEFLSSLHEICGLETEDVLQFLQQRLVDSFSNKLSIDLIDPIEAQFPALVDRLTRARSSCSQKGLGPGFEVQAVSK